MFRTFLRSLAALLIFSLPAGAQLSLPGAGSKSTARLVPENSAISAGKPFTLALELKHPSEWHSYYKNSGGIELSPEITWKLPEGFTAGPIQWPVPEIKTSAIGSSLIYSGSPVFLVEITPPANLPVGTTVSLDAKAGWQICKTSCISETKDFTIGLPVAETPAIDSTSADLFDAARKKLPVTNKDWKASAKPEGDGILFQLTPVSEKAKGVQTFDFEFVPDQQFIEPVTSPDGITLKDGSWNIPLKRRLEQINTDEIPQEDAFSGILVSKTGAFPAVTIEKVSLKETTAPLPIKDAPVQSDSKGILWICFSLFIGGLILNLMPCVFPVIGIKIMGFVQQAGHDRKKIAIHGIIFAAGVLLSFWILAAALYFGGLTSWGNQLQDPRVIFVTLVVMFLFGMNLFGVFEIGTTVTSVGGSLIHKQGVAGTFFSGVLATLIATPCSGPFLGVSIATASKLPVIPFFIAFTSMALGLSLPYLILSIFPSLVEKLPRPGMWMESFKQGMSFLLFAAAGYFLWVYSAQVFDGSDGRKGLWVLFGLSLIAAGAWVYGRWTQPYRRKGPRLAARIVALVFLVAGVGLGWPWPVPTVTEANAKPKIEWHPWSQEEEDRLLAAGQPVYIDFTARWCATCQVNKSVAYTPEVVELMKAKKIVALRADKTKPSPEIDAKLQKLGRNSIPVNVLLVPGNPTPLITKEILTPGDLTELFNRELP